MQTDTGGVGFSSFLQMMVALGIVLVLLKFVMPKLVTKFNKKIVTKAGSAIQIEETAAFAGGSLYVVTARSKTLLLSVSSQGVSCLSDLTPANPAPELPSFQELVEREIEGPLQPFAAVEFDPDTVRNAHQELPSIQSTSQDTIAALERLKRLAG